MLVEVSTRIRAINPLLDAKRKGNDTGLTAREIAQQSGIEYSCVETVLSIWMRWHYLTISGDRYQLTDSGVRFADKIK